MAIADRDTILAHPTRFNESDVTPELHAAAEGYLETWEGDFDFLRSVKRDQLRMGALTRRQAAGVLNCMRAELFRTQMKLANPIKKAAEVDTITKAIPSGSYTVAVPDASNSTVDVELRIRDADLNYFSDLPVGTQVIAAHPYPNDRVWRGIAFLQGTHFQFWRLASQEEVEAVRRLVDAKADLVHFGKRYSKSTARCWICDKVFRNVEEATQLGHTRCLAARVQSLYDWGFFSDPAEASELTPVNALFPEDS